MIKPEVGQVYVVERRLIPKEWFLAKYIEEEIDKFGGFHYYNVQYINFPFSTIRIFPSRIIKKASKCLILAYEL